MPGTIQVSVLEFMGLQQSSSPSEMSLKISMGKREYQTQGKEDFSFPLKTMRDNLIVTLQDAEGRDISHSVVQTKLVIEKGIWDDLFPIEGVGYVHMKLQFILSEEDRHRIRLMRQSALKKKRDELLNSELRSPEHAIIVRSKSASSLQPNKEFSDSHKSLLQSELIQASLRSTTSPLALSKTENSVLKGKEETHSVPKHINPNDTDRYEDASSSSPVSCMSDPNKHNLREKSPSKIRNMISAFESSLNQDMRPKIRPASVKSQSSKTVAEISSGSTYPYEVSSVRACNKATPYHDMDHLDEATTENNQHKRKIVKNNAKFMHKVGIQDGKTSSEDFARALTNEKASASGRMLTEKPTHPLSNLFSRRRLSGENLIQQKSRKEFQPNNLQNANSQGGSADGPYTSEGCGAWIFPDGGKRLCITTSGKKIMDLMGDSHSEAAKQPRKMTSPEAEIVKEVEEDGEASPRGRKSKTEDSIDAESSRGLVGQVMRVVIMVGFATLVLFTRQRNPGK